MKLYPLMANLEGRDILIVGGGSVATRKALTLIGTGAHIHIISPEISPEIQVLANKKEALATKRAFISGDIDGKSLIFAATDNKHLNKEIVSLAKKKGIPVNNATDPVDCTFLVPASLRKGALTIAISTSGKSPAVARWIRETLEKDIGPEYEKLTDWMGLLRQCLLEQDLSTGKIRDISKYLLAHNIRSVLKKGDNADIISHLTTAFETVLAATVPETVLSTLGLSRE